MLLPLVFCLRSNVYFGSLAYRARSIIALVSGFRSADSLCGCCEDYVLFLVRCFDCELSYIEFMGVPNIGSRGIL